MPLSAKVIKDSVSNVCGTRLVTFEVEFHRFILPELNTYRMWSRNYQSSRAVPVASQLKMVREDPAIPVFWGKNQPGMQADEECTTLIETDAVWTDEDGCPDYEAPELLTAEEWWRYSARLAANQAEKMHEAGYHKQIVNRMLEPFSYTRGILTATMPAFEHMFYQRIHPAAQPEFQALAKLMKQAVDLSEPTRLRVGEAHLPYVDSVKPTKDNLAISMSCCAQVSYRKSDDSLEKALDIVSKLNLDSTADPAHASPAEHQAIVDLRLHSPYNGNFSKSWSQYRKVLGV